MIGLAETERVTERIRGGLGITGEPAYCTALTAGPRPVSGIASARERWVTNSS